jgi:hypothetical protein
MGADADTEKQSGSGTVSLFIGGTVVGASAVLAESLLKMNSWHVWQFATLLVVAALTARLKVKLPGVNGNMSVSLPFLLIAMTHLSMPEAVLTAAVSVLTQSVPKGASKLNLVHALFNVSTAILASAMGWETFHRMLEVHSAPMLCFTFGCAMYFFASTTPVAGIIALTEKKGAVRTWSEIVHLSFPYCVASTGLASIAASEGVNTPWPLLLGMLCVVFVMYRSYRVCFGFMNTAAPAPTIQVYKTKSAATAL